MGGGEALGLGQAGMKGKLRQLSKLRMATHKGEQEPPESIKGQMAGLDQRTKCILKAPTVANCTQFKNVFLIAFRQY